MRPSIGEAAAEASTEALVGLIASLVKLAVSFSLLASHQGQPEPHGCHGAGSCRPGSRAY